jgi:hypothetical protein
MKSVDRPRNGEQHRPDAASTPCDRLRLLTLASRPDRGVPDQWPAGAHDLLWELLAVELERPARIDPEDYRRGSPSSPLAHRCRLA